MKCLPAVVALLCALAAPATVTAARLPDLRPVTVAAPPEVAPGGTLRVSSVVRNAGRTRARASALGWSLVRAGRVPLGESRLKALAPGRRARSAARLRLPAGAAGEYRLQACADAARRVRERSERNNCRTAGRVRLLVPGSPAPQPGGAGGGHPAPAPALAIPPLDPGAATSLADSVAFLHSGANPVQQGVAPGTISERRAAALRGTVIERSGAPLQGVTVTVHGHPEFGSTRTQADGGFQLVVNGGGPLTIALAKPGYADVQRTVDTPWEDWVTVDSVVMIPLDPRVTTIERGSDEPFQVARATATEDADGARRATLLFPRGVTATMRMPSGERRPLGDLSVRATEYTAGDAGDAAMPGSLPPSSGYTYAAAFTVDEAERAGAASVEFDRPVLSYTENFIGAEVGSAVPAGYYDPRRAAWEAAPNGRVVKIVSETGGVAALEGATGLDVGEDERRVLARLYEPGQELWRVPLEHFTPWDLNWPFGPPPGATPPLPWFNGEGDDPCEEAGSIIGCESQTLGERVRVTGTPFDLVYSSHRQPGWRAGERIRIPITAGEIPDRLKGVQLTIDIAGRRFEQRWEDPANPIQGQTALPDLEPNLHHVFTWDGKDAFGRPVQGSPVATIRVTNVYDFVYYPSRSGVASSFAQLPGDVEYFDGRRSCGNQRPSWTGGVAAIAGGAASAADPATDPHFFCGVPVGRTVKRPIGAWSAAGVGLGGWTLSVHHAYDPVERKLHEGDGSQTSAAGGTGLTSRLVGGGGGTHPETRTEPFPAPGADLDSLVEAAVGPDGSIYAMSGPCSNGHGGIRRIARDGMISQFAGLPRCGEPTGDGGPARQAVLGRTLRGIDVGPDGSVYLSVVGNTFPNGYIRRIAPDGTISTLAGVGCACGPMGDGGPAAAARVTDPLDVEVAPDGSVYFGERAAAANGNKARIRRIDPSGVIETIAGGGVDAGPDEDVAGEPATRHNLALPYGMAFAPDGSLYVAHPTKHVVTRIGTDGLIRRVAGDDQLDDNGPDGRPALETGLGSPVNVAVDAEGTLHVRTDDPGSEGSEARIRKLLPDGTVTTVAGRLEGGCSFTLSPAQEAAAYTCIERTSRALEVGPNGTLVYTDGRYQVRRLEPALPGFGAGGISIPSGDGSEVYAFDASGRHLRTLDTLTGALRWRFEYDEAKRLAAVIDGEGDTTRIERDAAGRAVAIVGPRGQRTALAQDGAGRLEAIADPAGNRWRMRYDGGGLLTAFADPRGGESRMEYDGAGRLVRDVNPEGGVKTLTRTETAAGVRVEVRTGLGRTTAYVDERLPGGARRRTVRTPGGAETTLVLRENGSRTLTKADGTTITSLPGADPRFGMALPLTAAQTVVTPDGRRREMATRHEARLDDPTDPLSAASMSEQTAVGGKTWTRTWDRASLTLRVDTPEGRRREVRFDEHGRVESERADPRVEPVTLAYDEHGRLTRLTQGDRWVALGYAPGSDRPATRRDATGREWAYAYDAAERLVGIRLPSGARYGFGHDQAGALTSVTMPNGEVHRIGRDGLGRETAYTPPGGPGFTLAFDLDGAPALGRMPGGRTLDLDRDAAGRLERLAYSEADVALEYGDATGRVRAIGRAPGPRLELEYDGDLIERMATADGAFSWAYDDMLRPTGRTLASGGETVTTAFEYDDDSLPRRVGPFVVERSGPGGAASAVRDGTVLTQTWTYDALGRPDVRTQTVGGRVAYKLDLAYDAGGRVVGREETVDGVKRVFAYAYDPDGRLVEVRRDGAIVERYGYDANGNRLSARSGDAAAEGALFDRQDRLVSRAGVTYESDADGFVRRRGADAFVYSTAGELLSATVGGRTVTYGYDGLGRRVSRTEGGATERYLYGNPDDRFQVSAVRAADGTLSVLHYDDQGLPFALERGGRRFYVGSDQAGTPRVVTDGDGAVVKKLEFDAFGRPVSDSNPAWELPIGFAGGLPDPLTGLVRFGVRDYDPAAGRWTARDPIRFAAGQGNLYAYAGSDPIDFRDTNGMNRGCDCPLQSSLNDLKSMAGFAAWGMGTSGVVGAEMAGMTAAGDAITQSMVNRGMVEAVKTLSVRGVAGLGNGMVAAEIAAAEATVGAELAAAQAARSAAMAAGAKTAGAFAAGVAAGLVFNRWWDCTYGKSFGESVYDFAARRGWVPE